MHALDRRTFLKAGASSGIALGPLAGLWVLPAAAQQADSLTIAYNVGAAELGPDHRPVGRQPDDAERLEGGVRPVHRPGPRSEPSSPGC